LESLEVLLVLHLVLVVEDEEGLSAGVGRVPELEGRPALARKLLLDALARSSPNAVEVPDRSGASTVSTSAFCFPLSEGESSTVRSIRAGVDPWGGASVSTTGTTACMMGGGTTAPRSVLTTSSIGRSCCDCGSSHTGCDSGRTTSCPASGGTSTTSFDFSTSAHPTS
jgi:hypothetical protein